MALWRAKSHRSDNIDRVTRVSLFCETVIEGVSALQACCDGVSETERTSEIVDEAGATVASGSKPDNHFSVNHADSPLWTMCS